MSSDKTTDGPSDLQPFWGITHFHVRSDICHRLEPFQDEHLKGLAEQIDEVYTFVRDEMGYDFVAYTDHHDMGEMTARGYGEGSPWPIVVDAWQRWNQPGRFTTLLGYEYQGDGEFNVFLNRDDVLYDAPTIHELLPTVPEDVDGVLLGAHNRPNPTDWQLAPHRLFRLVEIINDGGKPFETWALQGLAGGFRLGFLGGSDDHSCTPGRNSSTCLWASENTRPAIWDALASRRSVATSGIRPKLWFAINGQPLGSELACDGPREIRVQHDFNRAPAWVGVIRNGQLLEELSPAEPSFQQTWTDPAPAGPADCYYIKCIYDDGHFAYASPIWVTADAPARAAAPAAPQPAALGTMQLDNETLPRAGRNKWFNANGLAGPDLKPSVAARDMVVHAGPDPLWAEPDGSLLLATMDAIVRTTPAGESETIYPFTDEDEPWVLRSLIRVGETIIAAGYRDGLPLLRTLAGPDIATAESLQPIAPYFYDQEFVTPSYLASDGRFFACLRPREGALLTRNGAQLGLFQQGYPAFPCDIAMRSLSEIYVLGFPGELRCYSFAAASSGELLWSHTLDGPTLSLALIAGGVAVFNGDRVTHDSATTAVRAFNKDGEPIGQIELDLKNRRGTALVELPDGRWAGLHNPSDKVSVVYRPILNESATLRLFRPQA
jgi:hypothetical protein